MADSLGSITFTIPYTSSEITQTYLNDYDYTNTGFTNGYPNSGFTATSTGYTFIAIGTSRLSELKKYGSNGYTQSITSGSLSDGTTWSGYTIDTLNFQDFSDSLDSTSLDSVKPDSD